MAELVYALVLGTSGATHGGSSPLPPIYDMLSMIFDVCGGNSVVECHLAKVDVMGSSPIRRSFVFINHPERMSFGRRCLARIEGGRNEII